MSEDIGKSRRGILALRDRLRRYLVGREEAIDVVILAMTAGEPLLLLGPPGTAKSDLIYKFTEAIGLGKNDYFEYMITAFTEPSEIIGPVDIRALREEGVYRRKLDGKLADASVVFLDEIFNGNSAILNTLLTVMNEGKIYDGGQPYRLEKLAGFFAASNRIPERDELAALRDRFVLKVELSPVQEEHFDHLIDAGMHNQVLQATGQKPWVSPDCVGPADFRAVRRHINQLVHQRLTETPELARFPEPVHGTYRRIIRDLAANGVPLSDREVIKVYRLIILHGFLFSGRLPETITLEDLGVLRYVGDSEDQFSVVRKCVDSALAEGQSS